MSNYKQLREVIKRMSGQDNIITIPKIYIEFTGDLTTAALLNQIVFYSDKGKRQDGFFYKSYKDWENETGLTKRQVSYSIKKLKELGFVETKLKKANGAPTIHYKLDYDKMLDSIVTKCNFPLLQNVTIDSDKMSQSLTENTTEITTENTTDIYIGELFDYWNQQNIIKHRSLTTKTKSHINARLVDYTKDELTKAISNYQTVLTDDKYYWTHKWSLQDFMKPNNVTRFVDEAEPLNNFLSSKKGGVNNARDENARELAQQNNLPF